MSNRKAFEQLPDGCDPLGFDVDITPSGFVFCDIPAIYETVVPIPPYNLDIGIPLATPFCPCFPDIDETFAITQDSGPAEVHFTMTNESDDCCDPAEMEMTMSINVPCPISGGGGALTGTIDDVDDLTGTITVSPNASCGVDVDVDISMPCMPFEIEAKDDPEDPGVALGEEKLVAQFVTDGSEPCKQILEVQFFSDGLGGDAGETLKIIHDIYWSSGNEALQYDFGNYKVIRGRIAELVGGIQTHTIFETSSC